MTDRRASRLRPWPRRSHERGATAVFVGISIIGLLAMVAFAFDYGRIYIERRELQSGADAAALAIAGDCAAGLCVAGYDEFAVAEQYANLNAPDGVTEVRDVDLDLSNNSVTVVLGSEDLEGNKEVQMVFAPVIGIDEFGVGARAVAAWGPPGSAHTVPLIFSECEWDHFGVPGMVPGGFLHDKADIPFTGGYPHSPVKIYFHGQQSPDCHSSSSGQDLPGGFGWLDTDGNECAAATVVGAMSTADPGSSPSNGCDPQDLADMMGTVQVIPYFDISTGNGNNASYRVYGYGALYITGYYFAGQYKAKSLVTNSYPCSGSSRCLEGYFLGNWTVPPSGGGGGGGATLGISSLGLTE